MKTSSTFVNAVYLFKKR